jgi:hypothetical protein
MAYYQIKYTYAFNEDKKLVSIKNVNKNDNVKYTCITCGESLVPKIGEGIRERHFSHLGNLSCSSETYLHQLGKLLFFSEYNMCLDNNLPFYITINSKKKCHSLFNTQSFKNDISISCSIGGILMKNNNIDQSNISCNRVDSTIEIDLTKHFNKYAKLEVVDGDFIPDVLLENDKGDKIYFEVYVKHAVEPKKINSGIRIIEFNMNFFNNINQILSHSLLDFETYSLYNFRPLITADTCSDCAKYVYYFNKPANDSDIISFDARSNFLNIHDFFKKNLHSFGYIFKDALHPKVKEFAQNLAIHCNLFKITSFYE